VGLIALTVLVSGCGASDETKPPVAQVAVTPGDGANEVNPGDPTRVNVQQGRLDHVALTNSAGEVVPGEISPNLKSWKPTENLSYDDAYQWTGTAVGTDGKTVSVGGEFRTLKPEQTVSATISPTDDDEVGVAMPISVEFDEPVQDKAAVERALRVRPSEPVEGSWAWLNDKQVDWRPKEYWPAYTHVRVEANLYGVPHGEDLFGGQDASADFDIGRNQVVKADVQSHQIVVERDGQEVATYPSSYGLESDPGRRTRNGTYIVMERNPTQVMSNQEYGYFNETYTWAVRFSNHGEFIHENNGNASAIGNTNNSHGCVNMTGGNAKEYFDSAQIGDPVEVTGSASDMEPGYDVYDWQIDWADWQEMSALHGET